MATKKLNTNSNVYTIVYAAVMVVIVAFLLAFVSSSLKSIQEKNVQLDTKKQILSALNLRDVTDADAEFERLGMKDMLLQNGELVENDGPFETVYKGEIANGRLHVFECSLDGETKYIIPVYGAGLWGPIWGYVALNADKNTVFGVYFSHSGETPGLGAEITNYDKFQKPFEGKTVLNEGEVALGVMKNGKVENPQYEVDGISGGTITSKGVDTMLKDCLKGYVEFLTTK